MYGGLGGLGGEVDGSVESRGSPSSWIARLASLWVAGWAPDPGGEVKSDRADRRICACIQDVRRNACHPHTHDVKSWRPPCQPNSPEPEPGSERGRRESMGVQLAQESAQSGREAIDRPLRVARRDAV